MSKPQDLATLTDWIKIAGELEQSVIDSRGELDERLELMLACVTENMPAKVDATHFVLERLKLVSEWWHEQQQAARRTEHALESIVARIKGRTLDAMAEAGLDEIRGLSRRFVRTESPGRLVVDQDRLPGEYQMQITQWVPDREKIKLAIEAGIPVPGAAIEKNPSLRSYANRGDKK